MDENTALRQIEESQNLQRREIEQFLKNTLLEGYSERQATFWNRDYSSVEKYLSSVAENRERWQRTVGSFTFTDDMRVEEEEFLEEEDFRISRISLELGETLRARALVGLPEGQGPFPLVICQHGYTSAPENVFGFADHDSETVFKNIYHSYGTELLKQGFAVLAPLNIAGPRRNRLERLAQLLGKSLFGFEISRTTRLLDYACSLPEIDKDNIAMWGISMGGNYTMFMLPLEERIKVGICSAFFNERLEKMAAVDYKQTNFLPQSEYEHQFLPGWLREFTDSDLVSLICPRPFMIQTGKGDRATWWQNVVEEFEDSKEHYEKLGVADRIQLCLHEGGHEIALEEGIDFLQLHLR